MSSISEDYLEDEVRRWTSTRLALLSSPPARTVGPLSAQWQQWNVIQVVVVGDQGAIVGKKYWVDVESADALSPPAR